MLVSIKVDENPIDWFLLEDPRILGPMTKFLLDNTVLICDFETKHFLAKLLTEELTEFKRNYLVEFISNAILTKSSRNSTLDFLLKNDNSDKKIRFEDLWHKSLAIVSDRSLFVSGFSSERMFQSTLSLLASLATKARIYDKYAYVLIAPEKSTKEKYLQKQIDLTNDNVVDWLLAFPDLDIELHTLADRAEKQVSESGEPIKGSFHRQAKKLALSLEKKILQSGRSSTVNTTLFTYQKYTEAHHDRWVIFEIGGKDVAVQLPGGLSDFLYPVLPAPKNLSINRGEKLISGIKNAWENRVLIETKEPGKSREAVVLRVCWKGAIAQS